MSLFWKDYVTIESDNETLEKSDEWIFSDERDVLDHDDEETSDYGYEFDEDGSERARNNVNPFKNCVYSNLHTWGRAENEEDANASQQGGKIVTYADKHVEDIDPLQFLI